MRRTTRQGRTLSQISRTSKGGGGAAAGGHGSAPWRNGVAENVAGVNEVGTGDESSVIGLGVMGQENGKPNPNRTRVDVFDAEDPPAELCAGAEDAAAAEDPADAPAEEDMAVCQ